MSSSPVTSSATGSSGPQVSHQVPLRLYRPDQVDRRGEPVCIGVPFPKGQVTILGQMAVCDATGQSVPTQAKALDRWSDGSVRWALIDWQAQANTQDTIYTLNLGTSCVPPDQVVAVQQSGNTTSIGTGPASFECRVGDGFPLQLVRAGGETFELRSRLINAEGHALRLVTDSVEVLDSGPVCARLVAAARWLDQADQVVAECDIALKFACGSASVGLEYTLRNPQAAVHPGGFWDLGDPGSLLFRELSVEAVAPDFEGQIAYAAEDHHEVQLTAEPVEVYQDSSGGDYWKSTNHLNRDGKIPLMFQGYRRRVGQQETFDRRACPLVSLTQDGTAVASVGMQYFWENFPKAVTAEVRQGQGILSLGLFPPQVGDLHELQGGEQKTHCFFFQFGPDGVTNRDLHWARRPLVPLLDPAWVCQSGAIVHLTPQSAALSQQHESMIRSAIEGENNFSDKREAIDEFGWRHFGDVYGDHEAKYHQGDLPLISHYNNQYDVIYGMGVHYLRSADPRWWWHHNELAAHVADIDIYHTRQDKPAYNGGSFWHTYHYLDAGKATHRAYPSEGVAHKGVKPQGGGPGVENGYARGLCLNYFLTGCQRSKKAALELADWLIAADDGKLTVFRFLSPQPTGVITAAGNPNYQGPGRGSANALDILQVGFLLTGQQRYLDKAEEVIRRVTHPRQDLEALNLLDAETRWYYNMYLQNLGRYLDLKAELGQLDQMYAYGQAVLLRMADWMAEHEYPYLEKPEILEYPNETWVGQDMRKVDVFLYAAKHASGDRRDRFLERAEFFYQYATEKLPTMETHRYCRPIVLMMVSGWMYPAFKGQQVPTAPPAQQPFPDTPAPPMFVPQKTIAIKRAKLIALAGAALGVLVIASGIVWLISG